MCTNVNIYYNLFLIKISPDICPDIGIKYKLILLYSTLNNTFNTVIVILRLENNKNVWLEKKTIINIRAKSNDTNLLCKAIYIF